MPLCRRDSGYIEEKPLPGLVAHAWFLKLDFHGVVGMADDLGDSSLPTRIYLAVYPLAEVETATKEFPAPPLVAQAVVPERIAGKGRVWLFAVADEAARSVGIESEEEGYEEVVSIPERFIGLLANASVGSSKHHQHAEKHDMACDATSLGIVYLYR